MKNILLYTISIVFLTLVSCTKEEVPVAPKINNNFTPVFQYDNTTVAGVLEAANYDIAKSYGEPILILGDYSKEDMDIICNPSEKVCLIIIVHSRAKNRNNNDIIIAAPKKPIIKKGKLHLISSDNGKNKYEII